MSYSLELAARMVCRRCRQCPMALSASMPTAPRPDRQPERVPDGFSCQESRAGRFEPDGTWYSMIAVGGDLYAVEPNHGELDKITTSGQISPVVDISASQGHIVPTVIALHGNNFYVGNLHNFPIVPGSSKILKITPERPGSAYRRRAPPPFLALFSMEEIECMCWRQARRQVTRRLSPAKCCELIRRGGRPRSPRASSFRQA